jgi:hypothetical protein
MSKLSDRRWHPPGSFIGTHWQVQLWHVKGHWVTHTEHGTESLALAMAERLGGCTTFRVVQIGANGGR